MDVKDGLLTDEALQELGSSMTVYYRVEPYELRATADAAARKMAWWIYCYLEQYSTLPLDSALSILRCHLRQAGLERWEGADPEGAA